MKRPLLMGLGAILFVTTLAVAVTASVASDLRAVKEVLSQDPENLDTDEVEDVRVRLQRSQNRLDSLPARMLRFVPVVGQNLGALRDVVATSIPTMQAGIELTEAVSFLERDGVLRDGRVRIPNLQRLRKPIALQVITMEQLLEELNNERDGWLVPPLWESLDSMSRRVTGILEGARNLERLLGEIDNMLGAERPRRYLILLINNAELRGAGGLLSGVGTIEIDRGRIRVGDFTSVHELRDYPPVAVEAPPEYVKRFGVFDANTTLWLNATYSPDIPDVAVVASRLFRLKTGINVDGAIIIDPRGIAALLPEDEDVDMDELGIEVPVSRATNFIYSEAYDLFDDQEARRDALLEFGSSAIAEALQQGFGDEQSLKALAEAAAGEHIRVFSHHPQEQEILQEIGVAGELSPAQEQTGLLVTVQNMGGGNSQGTKLDYWARRTVSHRCSITDERAPIDCRTTTSLTNEAPPGLTEYVAGKDGVLRSYVETYVPQDAELLSVELNDNPVPTRSAPQADRKAVGVFVKVPRNETRRVDVRYRLPAPGGKFELVIDPQPLPHDADLHVRLGIPRGWTADGEEAGTEVVAFDGKLDRSLRFVAHRDERSGIAGLWKSMKRFWNDPLL